MSMKKYIPNMTDAIKIAVVVVVLTVTGIGVKASGALSRILKR